MCLYSWLHRHSNYQSRSISTYKTIANILFLVDSILFFITVRVARCYSQLFQAAQVKVLKHCVFLATISSFDIHFFRRVFFSEINRKSLRESNLLNTVDAALLTPSRLTTFAIVAQAVELQRTMISIYHSSFSKKLMGIIPRGFQNSVANSFPASFKVFRAGSPAKPHCFACFFVYECINGYMFCQHPCMDVETRHDCQKKGETRLSLCVYLCKMAYEYYYSILKLLFVQKPTCFYNTLANAQILEVLIDLPSKIMQKKGCNVRCDPHKKIIECILVDVKKMNLNKRFLCHCF